MARFKFARTAALALIALGGSVAFAGDTGTLNVSASVPSTCKFTAIPNMGFTIDPSAAGPATATSSVKYKCTKNTVGGAFAVGGVSNGATGYASGAASALAGTGGNTDKLEYSISWTNPAAFTGGGFGALAAEQTVLLTGSIAATQYQNATPDTYSGTVTITIAP
jgi:spore coat protein U-like protein